MRVRYSFSSRKTRIARGEHTNEGRIAFPKLAKDVIRISDIVLEVLDARFIEKTRNVDMEALVKKESKILIYVINKMDLANEKKVKLELKDKNLRPFVMYSCKSPVGRKQLRLMIKIMVKKGKFAEKHAKAHVGVIGYPNTGKSSLINTLAGGGKAAASSEFGFTKGIHRIRFNKDIVILDTPGVFKESENVETSSSDLLRQAEIGVRNASFVKNPYFIVHELMRKNPGLFETFYQIDADGDSEILVETIARKKGFLLKGNTPDADRAARYILNDWQLGKLTKTK
jgi:ribosome biogenesis GTPase A